MSKCVESSACPAYDRAITCTLIKAVAIRQYLLGKVDSPGYLATIEATGPAECATECLHCDHLRDVLLILDSCLRAISSKGAKP